MDNISERGGAKRVILLLGALGSGVLVRHFSVHCLLFVVLCLSVPGWVVGELIPTITIRANSFFMFSDNIYIYIYTYRYEYSDIFHLGIIIIFDAFVFPSNSLSSH